MTSHLPSDNASLLRLLESSPERAIELLYKEHQPGLVLTAYRLVRNQETARDLVQEVFIRFWQKRQQLTIQTHAGAYLHRSVINASLNYLQQQPGALKSLDDYAQLVHSGPAPEQELQASELSAAIERALVQLPARCRVVFSLNRYEELSYREIAAALGISPRAVEKEMMKALRLLRQALKVYLPLFVVLLLT
jgi:RNA polymerase sigma-70 factor (ECF subfamily)